MYGSGYGLGLIVAVIIGLFIEYLRWKHNRDRIQLKQEQIAERIKRKRKRLTNPFKTNESDDKRQS